MMGLFVTLEGGEGAGKSTLLAGLMARCAQNGIDVTETREPGGTPLAEQIRALVLNPPESQVISPLAEALMLNAARQDHLEKRIRPALASGRMVICDRFSDSTRAYQGAMGGVSPGLLRSLESSVLGETRPDLTLILDADPEALVERRKARGGALDAFEARPLSFHTAVRDAFVEIAGEDPDRCIMLNALRTPERLLDEAWAAILDKQKAKTRHV